MLCIRINTIIHAECGIRPPPQGLPCQSRLEAHKEHCMWRRFFYLLILLSVEISRNPFSSLLAIFLNKSSHLGIQLLAKYAPIMASFSLTVLTLVPFTPK